MYQGLSYDIAGVMPAALASGLFVSLATAQAPDGNFGPSGAPSGVFANITGLVDIPCMDAPPNDARIQATEVKAVEEILAQGWRHVLLGGFYPQFVAGVGAGWRVIVDGIIYDLIGAENDSQSTQTRLHLRLADL